MSGNYSQTYYIGSLKNFYSFYVEEGQLSFMSNIKTHYSRVRYVVPCALKLIFETFAAKEPLHWPILDRRHSSVKQILGTKIFTFIPLMFIESCPNIKLFGVVQRSNQFVVLGSRVYHGGFNNEYNVLQAIHFGDLS